MNNELKAVIDRELIILEEKMADVKYTGQWKGWAEDIIQKKGYTPMRIQSLGYIYLEGRGVPTDVWKCINLMEDGLRFIDDEESEKGDYYMCLAYAYFDIGRYDDYRKYMMLSARHGGLLSKKDKRLDQLLSYLNQNDMQQVMNACKALSRVNRRKELNKWVSKALSLIREGNMCSENSLKNLITLSEYNLDDDNIKTIGAICNDLKDKISSHEDQKEIAYAIAIVLRNESEKEYSEWIDKAAMMGHEKALEIVLDPAFYDDLTDWKKALKKYEGAIEKKFPITSALLTIVGRDYGYEIPFEIVDTLKEYVGEDDCILSTETYRAMVEGNYRECVRCYLKTAREDRRIRGIIAAIFYKGLGIPKDKEIASRLLNNMDGSIASRKDDPELRKEVAKRFDIDVDENGRLERIEIKFD